MGSSSKKKGNANGTLGLGASAKPAMGTVSDSRGVQQQYYKDPAQVPQSGGWVLPTAPPGAPQGIARNFVMPPPPAPRVQLAQAMQPRDRRWAEGGGYGGGGLGSGQRGGYAAGGGGRGAGLW